VTSRDLSRVGRDAFLRLAFERRGRDTILTERAFTAPLQVLEPIALSDDGSVTVVLLNPTGGVLGGDRLDTLVDLGPGTRVCVTTPSATRVYGSAGPTAVQGTRIRVGAGAILEYFPDHLIPHAGARFEQTLHVDLHPAGRAILWDGFALGRLARGERWAFDTLISRIEVASEGRPIFLDRLELHGGPRCLDGLGGAEGLAYVGTMVAVDAAFADFGPLVAEVQAGFDPASPVRGGASPLGPHGCFVRVLAASAHELEAWRKRLWRLLRLRLLGLGEADLRKL
jgi:urease accessory protein